MPSAVKSVAEYLASLPADRRAAISAVRDVVRKNLDSGYEEGIQYGMIGYYIPHRVFPAGYHCDPKQPIPFAALASQKNHMAVYLMGSYCGRPEGPNGETADTLWLRDAWSRTGKKLDMGKACIRFTKLDSLPLDVIGEAIRRIPAKTYLARYQEALGAAPTTKPTKARAKPATVKKGAVKKTP
jgi:hypothetical protein